LIVVDASVLANALADDDVDGRAARARLMADGDLVGPDLVDVETVAVLRKRWMAGDLSKNRFSVAIDDLEDLDLVRYPALPLMRRAFALRNNVTAYGAVYVALAERLECVLVTADQRLAAAPSITCPVELLRT
jgi:predicted nucleic acid-binding protein